MTDTITPETGSAFGVIDGEEKYRVRDLKAGDVRKVGGMVAKVTGDARIQNAVASENQKVVAMAVAACLLDRVPRDVALFCASLVGEDDNFDLKEYRKEEREQAKAEQRLPAPDGEIRYRMEEDIIEKVDSYPVDFYTDVIGEVMEKPSFDDFLASSARLGTAAQKGFSRFLKPSKNGSESQTES